MVFDAHDLMHVNDLVYKVDVPHYGHFSAPTSRRYEVRNWCKMISKPKLCTVPGTHGRQKVIPQKNAKKCNKFIKYFVEINKYEVNKNCRQKTKENV
jgi:hypothetical protein